MNEPRIFPDLVDTEEDRTFHDDVMADVAELQRQLLDNAVMVEHPFLNG